MLHAHHLSFYPFVQRSLETHPGLSYSVDYISQEKIPIRHSLYSTDYLFHSSTAPVSSWITCLSRGSNIIVFTNTSKAHVHVTWLKTSSYPFTAFWRQRQPVQFLGFHTIAAVKASFEHHSSVSLCGCPSSQSSYILIAIIIIISQTILWSSASFHHQTKTFIIIGFTVCFFMFIRILLWLQRLPTLLLPVSIFLSFYTTSKPRSCCFHSLNKTLSCVCVFTCYYFCMVF